MPASSFKLERILLDATQNQVSRDSGIPLRRLRQIEHAEDWPTDREKASLRNTELSGYGCTVLRFRNEEVVTDIDACWRKAK